MDLAGGLSRRQLDNCEKSVAASSASRYFSIQFFASLEKWIGARNPVRTGSSCAAVTGYNFPLGQSPKIFLGVKAGRRQSQEPEYLSGPPHSVVAVALCATHNASDWDAATIEKSSSQKEE